MLQMSHDFVLSLYQSMQRIRQFELRLQQVYRSGVMQGFIHIYVGEEAVAAGVCANLSREEYMTSTQPGRGDAIAKGVPMGEAVAEVWSKPRGVHGARGAS